jgi:hypothetical protein
LVRGAGAQKFSRIFNIQPVHETQRFTRLIFTSGYEAQADYLLHLLEHNYVDTNLHGVTAMKFTARESEEEQNTLT